MAQLLIEHTADLMAADRWGFTPLHEAALKGRTQLCALLVNHGADVMLRNHQGYTPYNIATVRTGRTILMHSNFDCSF